MLVPEADAERSSSKSAMWVSSYLTPREGLRMAPCQSWWDLKGSSDKLLPVIPDQEETKITLNGNFAKF